MAADHDYHRVSATAGGLHVAIPAVSTRTTGRETPAGVLGVVQKRKDHHSSLYDDAWMPNMLRITWNGIALHGGPLPGYAASHGCVRMPFGFAESLKVDRPAVIAVAIGLRQRAGIPVHDGWLH
jgi:lipoprotein-anchoring transpeptidase ErfK/SrfK